jgi:ATP-dependent helicase/nuclease subunit B
MLPPLTLWLGPAAAGKTTQVLRESARSGRRRIWVLVPSELHAARIKLRLADARRYRVLPLARAVNRVVRRAGALPPLASPPLRRLLLREELRRLVADEQLQHFAAVATKPGMLVDLLHLIDELQDSGIVPEQLARVTEGAAASDLGMIARAYESALARIGRDDAGGRLLRACALLESGAVPMRDVPWVIIDGFDQFTPLQLRFVRALATQVPQTHLTLTAAEQVRPAHRRFARTLAAIRTMFDVVDTRWIQSASADERVPELHQIERHLFELDRPPPVDAAGVLSIIAAADHEREVRAVLRQVRSLLAAGTPAEKIALIYREGRSYLPLLREIAAEYQLPLACYEGRSLREAPATVLLSNLLELPVADFPRRDLVASWRDLASLSPEFFGLEQSPFATMGVAARALERATAGGGVARGLSRLRQDLERLAADAPAAHDEEAATPVSTTDLRGLIDLLDAFGAWLAPPPRAGLAAYCTYVLGLLAEPDGPGPAALMDSVQRKALLGMIGTLRDAAQTVPAPEEEYAGFLAYLGTALGSARYGSDELQAGAVAVLPALAARGASFDHVLVLGLSAGSFPAGFAPPPFFTRRERTLMAADGIPLPVADPADERSLFYEVVTRARKSLSLSYTRIDEAGNPLNPSAYLTAVQELFLPGSVQIQTVVAGGIPRPDEVASASEELIVLEGRRPELAQLRWADAHLLEHVLRAVAIEQSREAPTPHGAYDGVVLDADLREYLAQHFGPSHRWSATQINDYGICPFRFAAAYVLAVGSRDDPSEGLEQVGRGRLYHRILAQAGERWAQLRLQHGVSGADEFLHALDGAATEVLESAPERFGFEPGPFWEWEREEVRKALWRGLQPSLEDEAWHGFRPVGFEAGFGMGRGAPPLRLDTVHGPVLLAGRIDRIDQDDHANLAVIDYKSNSTPRPISETLTGRDVQLTVYVLAVEQLLAKRQTVAQAAFVHLGSGKRSVLLNSANRAAAEEALSVRLAQTLQGVRGGDFAVRPRDECPRGCAFASICRVHPRKRGVQPGSVET